MSTLRQIKKTIALYALIAIIPCNLYAEYWGSVNGFQKSTMFMHDFMVKKPVNTTYYSHQGGYIRSTSSNLATYFYSGYTYAEWGATLEKKNPENPVTGAHLWSFWPIQPGSLPIDIIWHRPGFKGSDKGVGEGAAGSMGGFFRTLKPGEWERNLMKLWTPSDPELAKKVSYVGWWTKALTGEHPWKLMGVVEIPVPSAYFAGNFPGGFIEQYGPFNEVRSQSFRNIYTYQGGVWKANHFTVPSKPNEYHLIEVDKEKKYATFSYDFEPFTNKDNTREAKIRTKEDEKVIDLGTPELPTLEPILPGDASAMIAGNDLFIQWSYKAASSPQLRTKIALKSKQGTVLREIEIDYPQELSHLVRLNAQEVGMVDSAELTLEDVFHATKKVSVKVSPPTRQQLQQKLIEPSSALLDPASIYKGVAISYFEKEGALNQAPRDRNYCNWESLPSKEERGQLKQAFTVYQEAINLLERPRDFGVFGIARSNLQIAKPGFYRFHMGLSTGGLLRLGDQVIIDRNNGMASTTPESEWVFLRSGSYPLEVEFFIDGLRAGRHGMNPVLDLEIEGSGLTKGDIPLDMLSIPRDDVPGSQVVVKPVVHLGKGTESNKVTFRVEGVEQVENLEKIYLVSQKGEIWVTFNAEELEKKVAKTVLMPERVFTLETRGFIKEKSGIAIVNFRSVEVSPRNPPSPHWIMVEPQIPILTHPFGYTTTQDSVSLIGDGTRWAARQVEGDFTYTMRVKEMRNWVGENRNKKPWSAASVGFFASPTLKHDTSTLFDWHFDHYFKGRYYTPEGRNNGLRNESWQKSGHEITDPCHFRFSRKENLFTAEVKGEKESDWRLLFQQKQSLPKVLYLGPYLLQSSNFSRGNFYGAIFDQIQIEGKVLPMESK